jgi:hypothetical protein
LHGCCQRSPRNERKWGSTLFNNSIITPIESTPKKITPNKVTPMEHIQKVKVD